MGHSPKLKTAIDKSAEAKSLIEEEIRKAQEALANTEAKATEYINTHTKGIIQVLATNNNAYSKFTDEYSLKVLDGVVDGLSKTAKDLVANKDDKEKMAEAAIGDIAEVIKSTLALFSTRVYIKLCQIKNFYIRHSKWKKRNLILSASKRKR